MPSAFQTLCRLRLKPDKAESGVRCDSACTSLQRHDRPLGVRIVNNPPQPSFNQEQRWTYQVASRSSAFAPRRLDCRSRAFLDASRRKAEWGQRPVTDSRIHGSLVAG